VTKTLNCGFLNILLQIRGTINQTGGFLCLVALLGSITTEEVIGEKISSTLLLATPSATYLLAVSQ
jgi:hypothetical protein